MTAPEGGGEPGSGCLLSALSTLARAWAGRGGRGRAPGWSRRCPRLAPRAFVAAAPGSPAPSLRQPRPHKSCKRRAREPGVESARELGAGPASHRLPCSSPSHVNRALGSHLPSRAEGLCPLGSRGGYDPTPGSRGRVLVGHVWQPPLTDPGQVPAQGPQSSLGPHSASLYSSGVGEACPQPGPETRDVRTVSEGSMGV